MKTNENQKLTKDKRKIVVNYLEHVIEKERKQCKETKTCKNDKYELLVPKTFNFN